MPASDVRAALMRYLEPPAIPGLLALYRDMPVNFNDGDWGVGTDVGWGAGAYLHFNTIEERRISFAGAAPGGVKRVRYDAALVLLFRWSYVDDGPDNETDGWADRFDALLDAIKTRMRADRTFGCGSAGPIWQAGEGVDEGDEDIRTVIDLPREDSGQVVQWCALEFTVVEMISA